MAAASCFRVPLLPRATLAMALNAAPISCSALEALCPSGFLPGPQECRHLLAVTITQADDTPLTSASLLPSPLCPSC